MSTTEFISQLHRSGIKLWAEGDRLRFDAPSGAMTSELKEELRKRKPELIEFFAKVRRESENKRDPITAVSRQKPLPLSFAQQRLWFMNQLAPDSAFYNVPAAPRFLGPLNMEALRSSLNHIVERHETLRTTFREENGIPVQVIHDSSVIELPLVDLRDRPSDEREREAKRLASQEVQELFDLKTGPLLRARLICLKDHDHVLVLTMHHIVSDGWSMGVLLRDLVEVYGHYDGGSLLPSPLAIQYADFSTWQREQLNGPVLDNLIDYWKGRLTGYSQLNLPTDRMRPLVQTHKGRRHWFELPTPLSHRIKGLANDEGATLFMTMFAAFNVLLHRYTGQHDLVIGTPIANRNQSEIEGLIGFFVNSLVMRTDVSGDPTFRELLARVRERAVEAYAHQDLPFERLVEELESERDPARNPLFQVVFAVQNAPMPDMRMGDLTIRWQWAETLASRFDLEIHVQDSDDKLHVVFVYNTDLFDQSTIERMMQHFRVILEAVTENPELRLSHIPLTTEAEQHRLTVALNDTKANYPKDKSLVGLYEEQVKIRPDAVAVVCEQKAYTYRQINGRANKLARYLRVQGVGPEVCVGLCLERGVDLIVSLLAILKAGGAYVPLDPQLPSERLGYICHDADIHIFLTAASIQERLSSCSGAIILVDSDWALIQREASGPVDAGVTPENLAYIIYTSGSTGQPKGVLISHYNVIRLFQATHDLLQFVEQDVWTLFHSYAFDFSVWELWGALLHGGRVVVVPYDSSRSPGVFLNLLHDSQVTILNQTPSAFGQLVDHMQVCQLPEPPTLRWVIFGGEALNFASLQPWLSHCGGLSPQFMNMYGITETTVHVTQYKVKMADVMEEKGSIIGSPLLDLRVYLLDQHLLGVPQRVVGELYVGGAGVARGYLNRPGLTAERFRPDPFQLQPGHRMYQTGDLARYTSKGVFQFLGRRDGQVKLRGYRIELGEIESLLTAHPSVKEAVVVVRSEQQEESRLIAYVVPDHDTVNGLDDLGQEKGWDDDHVSNWQILYDQAYQQPSPESDDPTFNITGWNSSYTGEPIPAEHMREWVDHTVERIKDLHPKRVLEIGCGTGLLLTHIAPHCEAYTGVDFSQVALDHVQSLIETHKSLAHVQLQKRTANDLTHLEPQSFDTVIINSVTQYLPGIDYLTTVLNDATNLLCAGGHLFVGDVRSFPLLRAYHTSVQFHRAGNPITRNELAKLIDQHVVQEEELVIDPEYFHVLRTHVPRIGDTKIMIKRGVHHNELTKFRYDVVLSIEPQAYMSLPPCVLDWKEDRISLDDIKRRLSSGKHEAFMVKGIPDARLSTEMCIDHWISEKEGEGTLKDVGTFRAQLCSRGAKGLDVETLYHYATMYDYAVRISYSACQKDGSVDAIFHSKKVRSAYGNSVPPLPTNCKLLHEYGNNPLKAKLIQNFIPRIREYARRMLPDYMVPSGFTLLDSLPLTPNGKIDRRALPSVSRERQVGETYVAPTGELERRIARIWCEMLGVDRVGIRDNFFDLGGHSLLLTQVFSQLIKFPESSDLKMVELFQYPTVESLAKHLSQDVPDIQGVHSATLQTNKSRKESKTRSDIAVIGMAIRFPGANDTKAFWENLRDGVESIRQYSEDELHRSGIPDAVIKHPNYVKAKGAIDNPDLFDAGFFGYSPREAELIDPQHRVFLEMAWESLERAGYDPQRYEGQIGVYAGTSMNTYLGNIRTQTELMKSVGDFQILISNDKDFLPTRVSYKLNLRGPSVNVQTACSTSLVAIHEACRSLIDDQCDLALAGGVSVKVPTTAGYMYVKDGPVSFDGHCRSFDAHSQGTVWAEGVGIVVLKPLEKALADRDVIHAVIRGTAINNDGAMKIGFTAPSVQGQAEVVALAQAMAQVRSHQISYVETHGTATVLGDPIEVAALTKAFNSDRQQKQTCAIGSLKSNVGHMDAAAGVGGLIKTILALKHQQIPPSLHYQKANPEIDFSSTPFFVNDTIRPWPVIEGEPRIAGVSAFGIGGTNAHVVVEEAPVPRESGPSRSWKVLMLSAKSEAALDAATLNLANYLRNNPQGNLADTAYTLQIGRSQLAYRRTVFCRDVDDALASLDTPSSSRNRSGLAPENIPTVVFMFPGQGSQYIDMGLELYTKEPVFHDAFDECANLLEPHLGIDIRRVVYPPVGQREKATEQLQQTGLTQPALFMVEYALARLWMSWGITPAACIGHSIGEYVAACLSGVLTLSDALKLVYVRGRLMEQAPTGAMVALQKTEAEVQEQLDEGLCVSAVNSPSMCVVSGSREGIEVYEKKMRDQGVTIRRLHTSHAFHSSLMDGVIDPFISQVQTVSLGPPTIPFISNVTGTWITEFEACDPTYWGNHIRQPVRFSEGIAELMKNEDLVFLEVGPGRTLHTFVQQQNSGGAKSKVVTCLPHPRDEENDSETMARALGGLWLLGLTPDWKEYYSGERRHRVELPTYPFERQRHWIDAIGPTDLFTRSPSILTKNPQVADWFYIPTWNRSPWPGLTDDQKRSLEGASCVIYSLDSGLGEELARTLKAYHANCTVHSTSVRQEAAQPKLYPKYIIFIAPDSDDETGCLELMELVKRYGNELDQPPRLIVVTQTSREVTGYETLHPNQAKVAGLCIVIRQEYPQLDCRNVDVDSVVTGERDIHISQRLIVEMVSPNSTPSVAIRAHYRWVPSYKQTHLPAVSNAPECLRVGGTYLITGGLGRIGLELAEFLAKSVSANLVLMGRTQFPNRDKWGQWLRDHGGNEEKSQKIRRLLAMEAMGSTVVVSSGDVTDESFMENLCCEVEKRFGSLNGVFHLAAITSGPSMSPISEMKCEAYREQMRPKVDGLLVLDRILRERMLDFVVVTSSLASVLGGIGFSAYTPANAFIDTFTTQRKRDRKTPWLSVNWDGWRFGGERTSDMSPVAKLSMTPAEGMEAFARILNLVGHESQVLVSTADMDARLERWVYGRHQGKEVNETSAHPRPTVKSSYVAAQDEVEHTVVKIWQDLLGIGEIGIHDNFFELGGHSLLGTQMIARFKDAFDLIFSLDNLFEYPTPGEISQWIKAMKWAKPSTQSSSASPSGEREVLEL